MQSKVLLFKANPTKYRPTVAPKKLEQGITQTPSDPKSAAKRNGDVKKTVRRLAPWLAIANGERPVAVCGVQMTSDIFFKPLQQSVCASFERIIVAAKALQQDPGMLERYRAYGVPHGPTASVVWEKEISNFWPTFVIGLDGRLTKSLNNPQRQFEDALEHIDLLRLGRCELCERLFYRTRSDSDACSSPCGYAIRQRHYRANQKQYRNNRKWNEHARKTRNERREGKK
jgi:hypothetical protein